MLKIYHQKMDYILLYILDQNDQNNYLNIILYMILNIYVLYHLLLLLNTLMIHYNNNIYKYPYKKSNEKPADNLKFTPSYKLSFYDDYTTLFKFIKFVYSKPFFIDHSHILLSLLILTNDSPLSVPFDPLPTHYTSHTLSLCLPANSLFSVIGLSDLRLISHTATIPSIVPAAIKFGYELENLQQLIFDGYVIIRSGNVGFFNVQNIICPSPFLF